MKKSLDWLLAKGKKILKYGVYTAVGGLVTFLPMKEAMGQDVDSYLNVFAQPNPSALVDAHGSGDANEDGFLRRNDLEYMKELKPQNNQSDINGDGVKSDSLDIKLLEDLFSGKINYLPGHFNSFPIDSLRAKRNDWGRKMVTINQTDTIPNISPEFDCGEHAIMNILRLRGYNGDDIPDIYYTNGYDDSQNGEFNLPVYYAVFSTPSTPNIPSHVTNAMYIGPDSSDIEIDVTDPYQWLFFESLPPKDIFWENVRGPPQNSVIGIFGISGFNPNDSPILFTILGWETDSEGNINLISDAKHPNLVEAPTNLPTIEVDPPRIIDYKITNPIFSPNGDGVKDTSTIDLEFSEATNVELTIRDSAGNLINKLYSSSSVTNPKPKTWDGTYGESDIVALDGVYMVKVSLEDSAGNTFTDLDSTITLDTTPPEISITHPESDSTYTSHVTSLEYLVSDANPDSMWFSSDSGLTKTYVPENSPITDIKSEQGENNWIVYTLDKAGNEANDTTTFNVDTTSVNITGQPIVPYEYSLSQNYPNPFNPSTTIEYILSKRGDVSLNIYNLRGEKVEELVNQEQPPGPHKVFVDLSRHSSGIYFYRLTAEDDVKTYIKTRKMALLK